MADLQGIKLGMLRIAGVSTIEYFLAHMIKPFAALYPGIEIDLAIENRQAMVDRLQREQDDLAVMMLPPTQLPLKRFPFIDNPLVVVGALDHPWAQGKRVPMARMTELILLTLEVGSGTRLATEVFF